MNTRKPVQPPAPGACAQAFSFEERGLLYAGQLSQLVVDLGVVEDAAELLRTSAQRIDVDHRAGVGIGGVVHAGLVVDGVADGHGERDVSTVQLVIFLTHLALGGSADFQRAFVRLAQILHLVIGQQQLARTGGVGVIGQGQTEGLFFNSDFSDVVIKIGDVDLKIGSFISAIINFLIVAFVLFVVLKAFNALFNKKKVEEAPAEPTTKVCPYCQSEISIKAVRCPHCTSKLEGFPEIND